jgi:hypothetical protein
MASIVLSFLEIFNAKNLSSDYAILLHPAS